MVKLLKKRYIGFRFFSHEFFRKNDVFNLLKKELRVINENKENKTYIRLLVYENSLGILLCDHKSVNKIRDLFNRINKKNNKNILIKIINVSGTIKAVKHKIFKTI